MWVTQATTPDGLIGGLAAKTAIATPDGWSTVGDLSPGDEVFDENGRQTRVIAAGDAMDGCDCFELVFSDDWVLVAAADHLWVTDTRTERKRCAPGYMRRYPERFVGTAVERATVEALLDTPGPRYTTRRALADELGPGHTSGYARVWRASKMCAPVGKVGREWLYGRREILCVLAEMLGKRVGSSQRLASGPMSTTHVARTLRMADDRKRHGVLIAPPLELSEVDLPIPPRLLGLWLGDGARNGAVFTTGDCELVEEFRIAGYSVERTRDNGVPSRFDYLIRSKDRSRAYAVPCQGCGTVIPPGRTRRWLCTDCAPRYRGTMNLLDPRRRVCECGKPLSPRGWGTKCRTCQNRGSFRCQLASLDLLGNKHVPIAYLRASVSQRRALLSGLLDSDGTVTQGGGVEFDSISAKLSADVHELVCSLGYRATRREGRAMLHGEDRGPKWTVAFTTRDDVFALSRKRVAQAARLPPTNDSRTRLRYVLDVRPAEGTAIRRIRVENPTGLFLAGRGLVATHDGRAVAGSD